MDEKEKFQVPEARRHDYSAEAASRAGANPVVPAYGPDASLLQNVARGRSVSSSRHPFIGESEDATAAAGRTMANLRERRNDLLDQLREVDDAISVMATNLHGIAG